MRNGELIRQDTSMMLLRCYGYSVEFADESKSESTNISNNNKSDPCLSKHYYFLFHKAVKDVHQTQELLLHRT